MIVSVSFLIDHYLYSSTLSQRSRLAIFLGHSLHRRYDRAKEIRIFQFLVSNLGASRQVSCTSYWEQDYSRSCSFRRKGWKASAAGSPHFQSAILARYVGRFNLDLVERNEGSSSGLVIGRSVSMPLFLKSSQGRSPDVY